MSEPRFSVARIRQHIMDYCRAHSDLLPVTTDSASNLACFGDKVPLDFRAGEHEKETAATFAEALRIVVEGFAAVNMGTKVEFTKDPEVTELGVLKLLDDASRKSKIPANWWLPKSRMGMELGRRTILLRDPTTDTVQSYLNPFPSSKPQVAEALQALTAPRDDAAPLAKGEIAGSGERYCITKEGQKYMETQLEGKMAEKNIRMQLALPRRQNASMNFQGDLEIRL